MANIAITVTIPNGPVNPFLIAGGKVFSAKPNTNEIQDADGNKVGIWQLLDEQRHDAEANLEFEERDMYA